MAPHQAAPPSSSSPPAPPSVGPPACRVGPPGLEERWAHGRDTTARHTVTAQTHTLTARGTGGDLQEVSWYLEAVLSLAQLPPANRGSAVMADRSEAPREGDVSAPALCLQLLVLPLLVHINGNPELMLRDRPAQGQDTGPAGIRRRQEKSFIN